MPEVARTRDVFRQALGRARDKGERVGFVPTMGALHAGHLQLLREAKSRAPFTAVSIFVNPTQFGPTEDLGRYPRDLEGDLQKCASVGVNLVFAPDAPEIYPVGDATRVRVTALAEPLCGVFRPGHFEGVATVVAKLFALAAPCLAIFGRKDYQQLRVIERMARDLLFDVEVIGVPTVRDDDGLALSSRNAYLSPDERVRARSVPRGLAAAWSAFARGERRVGDLRQRVAREITPQATRVDYVTVADPDSLATIDDGAMIEKPALVAVAVWIEKTRLIDNVVLGEDPSPISSPIRSEP
jgi:pantoate--beta-alanine ligase